MSDESIKCAASGAPDDFGYWVCSRCEHDNDHVHATCQDCGKERSGECSRSYPQQEGSKCEYRELGPDEVVQEGDECAAKNADSSKEGNWSLACRSIDEQVSKWRHLKFRRRVSQQAAASNADDRQAQARKVAEGMGRKTADAILLEHREVVDGIMSGGLKVVAARDTMARIITDAITTALIQFAEQFGSGQVSNLSGAHDAVQNLVQSQACATNFGPEIESQASQDVPALPQEAQAKAVSRVEAQVSQEAEECKVGATQFGQCGVEGHAEAAGTPRLYEQCSTQQVSSPATVHSTCEPQIGAIHYCEQCERETYPVDECICEAHFGGVVLPDTPEVHACPNCAALQQQLDAATQRAEKAESKARDQQSTFEFGAKVMNRLILPRVAEFAKGEFALDALARWLTERDTLRAEVARLREACGMVQCECSAMERDSGHRTDCWYPAFEAALTEGKEAGK